VTTYREEGYDIQFRFRTTLESGQLVEGQGLVIFKLNRLLEILMRVFFDFLGIQVFSSLS
jgi:hypothetical protein